MCISCNVGGGTRTSIQTIQVMEIIRNHVVQLAAAQFDFGESGSKADEIVGPEVVLGRLMKFSVSGSPWSQWVASGLDKGDTI